MADWKGNYCWKALQDSKKDGKSDKIMYVATFKIDHFSIKTDPVSYKSDPLSIKSDPVSFKSDPLKTDQTIIITHIARNQLIYQPESETYNLDKTD